jgi:hypothetical protein
VLESGHAAAHHLDFGLESSITSRTASIKKLLENLTEEISSLNQEIWLPFRETAPLLAPSIPNSSVIKEISPRDWMRDLQLLHHYCSGTCMTLACDASIHHVWRDIVPQTACSHVSLIRFCYAMEYKTLTTQGLFNAWPAGHFCPSSFTHTPRSET